MKIGKGFITGLLVFVVFAAQAQVQTTTALLGSWSGKLQVRAISQEVLQDIAQWIKGSIVL